MENTNQTDRKVEGRHAAQKPSEEKINRRAISTDEHLYGDEADLPIHGHKRKQKKKAAKQHTKRKKHLRKKWPISVSKVATERGLACVYDFSSARFA